MKQAKGAKLTRNDGKAAEAIFDAWREIKRPPAGAYFCVCEDGAAVKMTKLGAKSTRPP